MRPEAKAMEEPDPQDLSMMSAYPHVPWLEGIVITTPAGTGIGCRVCIGRYGFRAQDVKELPQTEQELADHLRSFHHLDHESV